MREITQSAAVRYRMAEPVARPQHRLQRRWPVQTLRASAVAIPFVVLALLVAMLSAIVGGGQ
jgi:hypothetical protein